VTDGCDPESVADQAVDDAAGDNDTEHDEKRCQSWPILIIARLLCRPRMGAADHFS
jgi:hypothetical protein